MATIRDTPHITKPLHSSLQLLKTPWMKINAITILVLLLLINTSCHYYGDLEVKEHSGDGAKYELFVKTCQTCWMDIDFKKELNVSFEKSSKSFRPRKNTQLKSTRIIIGEVNKSSVLFQKGIERVILFPNELEILECFDFDNGTYLNNFEGVDIIFENYYSDQTLEDLVNDLKIISDVTL